MYIKNKITDNNIGDIMIIENKIREARESKNINLMQLEESTGINKNRLIKIEELSADKINVVEAILIAKSLHLQIEDLFLIQNIELR